MLQAILVHGISDPVRLNCPLLRSNDREIDAREMSVTFWRKTFAVSRILKSLDFYFFFLTRFSLYASGVVILLGTFFGGLGRWWCSEMG